MARAEKGSEKKADWPKYLAGAVFLVGLLVGLEAISESQG